MFFPFFEIHDNYYAMDKKKSSNPQTGRMIYRLGVMIFS